MKKHLTPIFFFGILSSAAFSQITITQSDLPSVGMQIIQAQDTTTLTLSPGAAGPSQTWNFSALLNDVQGTTNFINPLATPYATPFPAANIAIVALGANPADTIYEYLKSSAAEFNIQGINQPINGNRLSVKFNPVQKLITFPSTYMTAFQSNMDYDVTFAYITPPNIDSVRAKHTETDTSAIDGWGALTIPSGTFNCIRQKYITAQIDSLWIHSGSSWMFWQETITNDTTYRWWANGKTFNVLEMKFNGVLQKGITYFISSGVTSVKEQVISASAAAFPIPASDMITISCDFDKARAVAIFDINGNKISESAIGGKITLVNACGMPSGTYFYEIIGEDAGKLAKGKFIISR